MAEYLTNTTDLTKVASAIREKGGTSDSLAYPDGFVSAIQAIPSGGASGPVEPGDITFYDYEGTVVAAWTLAELAGKTALPDLPSHEGLICQGWNWTLADLKTTNRKMNVGAMYITDDGKTRIYIHLEEGRTSPMLAIGVQGTVTVDWGDGTTPNILTGTSTSTVQETPNHAYAAPGDYVIKLTVDGYIALESTISGPIGCSLCLYSARKSSDINHVYQNAIKKIELGIGMSKVGEAAISKCTGLQSITIPSGLTLLGANCFYACYNLEAIILPDTTGNVQQGLARYNYSLKVISLPKNAAYIGIDAFTDCHSLRFVTLPDKCKMIRSGAFMRCYALESIYELNNNSNKQDMAFYSCLSLKSITLRNIATIYNEVFYTCSALSSITIPSKVTTIKTKAFYNCYSIAFYDFSAVTAVPTLENVDAFNNIPSDCQIRVPSSLVDTWKAATNWSTYADYIVGV